MESNKTIVAISTPDAPGAIGIVRISGPDAITIADKIWKGRSLANAESHKAIIGSVISDGQTIDPSVMALPFRTPASYTGEDTVEFHLHGSPLILRLTVEALIKEGASPAGPGEFTMKAFLNHRIDLAQAEGIADLIAAQSKAAITLAATQVGGRYSARINELRDKLLNLATLLELELDFSEEDVSFASRDQLTETAKSIRQQIHTLIGSYNAGQAIRQGLPVVIAGAPNSGKSTLLNTLIDDDRAIVSNIPGTTRDAIEATANIGSLQIRYIDTAGIRPTSDPVEKIGIDRALNHIRNARIILLLKDPTSPESTFTLPADISPEAETISIFTKSDIAKPTSDSRLAISAKTGEGISALKSKIKQIAEQNLNLNADVIITNVRHREALQQADRALEATLQTLMQGQTADLTALHLRHAIDSLSEITGAITTSAILQNLFSSFCIGK